MIRKIRVIYLAGLILEHNKAVLAESGGLSGEAVSTLLSGTLKVMFFFGHLEIPSKPRLECRISRFVVKFDYSKLKIAELRIWLTFVCVPLYCVDTEKRASIGLCCVSSPGSAIESPRGSAAPTCRWATDKHADRLKPNQLPYTAIGWTLHMDSEKTEIRIAIVMFPAHFDFATMFA